MREALQTIDEAGHVAYVVGGSVRDFILGIPSKDHDIATSASPDEICELFPGAITVGKIFGVIKVPVHAPIAGDGGSDLPVLLEIATFREDLEYRDHRRPRGVKFSTPENDARRRDFTINALFYDAKTKRILDPTGGVADLRHGTIRAIGDASERFREDALRLLRAVRFSARLGFSIEPTTADALRARSKLLSKVSSERVRDELGAMWRGPRADLALRELSDFGLLSIVLPEVEALKARSGLGSLWEQTLRAMSVLGPGRSPELSWAVLLHEVATPETPYAVTGILARLKLPAAEVDRVRRLIENHHQFKDAFKMREATLHRLLRDADVDASLELHRIVSLVTDGNLAYHEFCSSRLREMREHPEAEQATQLLDGKDLIQLGLSPGPEFSEILRVVEDLAIERKLESKEEALEYVVRHFVR